MNYIKIFPGVRSTRLEINKKSFRKEHRSISERQAFLSEFLGVRISRVCVEIANHPLFFHFLTQVIGLPLENGDKFDLNGQTYEYVNGVFESRSYCTCLDWLNS